MRELSLLLEISVKLTRQYLELFLNTDQCGQLLCHIQLLKVERKRRRREREKRRSENYNHRD